MHMSAFSPRGSSRVLTAGGHPHGKWVQPQPPGKPTFTMVKPADGIEEKEKTTKWSKVKAALKVLTTIVCMVACFCLCIWQLSTCVGRYMSFQVIPDVSIFYYTALEFPAMTICPWNFSTKLLIEAAEKKCKEKNCDLTKINETNFENYGFDLTDYWMNTGITHKDIDTVKLSCNLSPKKEKCESDREKGILFNHWRLATVYGVCLQIQAIHTFHYQVQKTDSWWINVSKNAAVKESKGSLQVLVHTVGMHYKHDIATTAKSVHEGKFITRLLILSSKDFRSLHSPAKPCTDEASAVAERNGCVENIIDNLLDCRLPFYESSKQPCSTLGATLKAYLLAKEVYEDTRLAKCNIPRVCKQIIYSVTSTEETEAPSETHVNFYLNYLDNIKEIIAETFDYALSSLLSDIAGNTGFFLGISLVGMIESGKEMIKKKRAERKAFNDAAKVGNAALKSMGVQPRIRTISRGYDKRDGDIPSVYSGYRNAYGMRPANRIFGDTPGTGTHATATAPAITSFAYVNRP